MRPHRFGLRVVSIIGLLLIDDWALAQNSIKTPGGDSALPKKSKSKTTFVDIELLQTDDGSGLFAQHWLKVLGPLDVSLRIHRPTSSEKPEIKERESSGLRYVTAIGTLDRSGKIVFPGKEFAVGDSNKFKEWLDELRTYGARGVSTGKPLWGLTKTEFAAMFDALCKATEFETLDMPLSQVVAKLPLPSETPVHWSKEATDLLARRNPDAKLKVELKGFSAATALAVALNENGLGFRPNRTPRGDAELLIELRSVKFEQWPIGWPLQLPRFKAAPKLFAVVPIELSDIEFSDVIYAASKLTETPILIDYAELESKQINLEKILVSYPRKKTTWDVALRSLTLQHRMTEELWQDEAGRSFLWITTSRAGRSQESERPKP